jgi:hypothetical protein
MGGRVAVAALGFSYSYSVALSMQPNRLLVLLKKKSKLYLKDKKGAVF